jgi:hypothetical protein
VTISVRSISAEGIVLRSVVCSGPAIAKRRPLTSTRLRVAPKPRRLTSAVPPGTVFEVAPPLVEATNCGCSLSRRSTLTVPAALISPWSTTATGVEASKPSRLMREPVTTMSLSDCADDGVAAGCGVP